MSRDAAAPAASVLPSPAAREAAKQRALQLFAADVEWEETLLATESEKDAADVIRIVSWDANVREAGGIDHFDDACRDAEVVESIKRMDDQQGQRLQRLAAPAMARHAEAYALYQAHEGLEMEVFKMAVAEEDATHAKKKKKKNKKKKQQPCN
jgi:hypothetical protein